MGMMERIDSSIAAPARECLSFQLGGEEYGIDILAVQEIRAYERPTRIANAPEGVLGIINLRGAVVPIVDLRVRLGFANPKYDVFTVVIILNLEGRMSGVVVDAVSDVLQLKPEELRDPPELARGSASMPVQALAVLEGRMIVLLDIERMLSDVTAPAQAEVAEAS
jgi:purine-binding chemotaxis protein CheW